MLAPIPSPSSNAIQLDPLQVHAYGLCLVVATVAVVQITARRWAAQGGSRELPLQVSLWGVPAGILGGRLYYLATSWNEVPDHWWAPLDAVWRGGLGIWGGSLGTLAGSGGCGAPASTSRVSSLATRPGSERPLH